MVGSINMNTLIGVVPSVLGAGGNAIDLVGLVLTPNLRCPVGQVLAFPNVAAVQAYFGVSSDEALAATAYFNGFDNSDQKPGSMLFTQYNTVTVSAYLRGASLATMTLAQLQALTGTFSIVVDGVTKASSGPVVLASATSFSNAATLISTALAGALVTFDSISQTFVVTSPTAGLTSSSVTFATGSLAIALGMVAGSAAAISPAANIQTPLLGMTAAFNITRNFGSFTTLIEPSLLDKLAFALWANNTGNLVAYIPWDTDPNALVQGNMTCFAYQLYLAAYSGTAPVFQDRDKSLMIMGTAASIDFKRKDGRVNFAFRGQAGLLPTVTDSLSAATLKANNYNYYGNYSTAKQAFNFLYPGNISGPFLFLDSFFNQIWLNANLQLALVYLATQRKSIPYNQQGYAAIESALLDPVLQALSFGAIRGGVTLSQAQIDNVNNAAGLKIDGMLSTRGWYVQVLDAAPSTRTVRGTPPMKFWYMDGGNIQSLNLASVEVQ